MLTGTIRSVYEDRNRKRGGRSGAPAQRAAGELLLRFGVTPHLCGFDPLCGAIRFSAERDRTEPPSVGMRQICGALCRERSPEHALRDAIGIGFLTADGIHAEIFPFSNRPGSAEFVCTLAELVRDCIAER